MAIVAFGSFPIRTFVSNLGMSWNHALPAAAIVSVVFAIFSIRNGWRRAHMAAMIGSFSGSVVAGLFTLHPERHISAFLSGLLQSMLFVLTNMLKINNYACVYSGLSVGLFVNDPAEVQA